MLLRLLLLASLVAGLVRLIERRTPRPTPPAPAVGMAPDVPTASPEPDDSLLAAFLARAPLRLSRRPAERQRGADETGYGQPGSEPPRPTLLLAGTIMGPARMALLAGLPGIEGMRAVREGERVAGIRVVRVRQHQAILVGFDTTWSLTVTAR